MHKFSMDAGEYVNRAQLPVHQWRGLTHYSKGLPLTAVGGLCHGVCVCVFLFVLGHWCTFIRGSLFTKQIFEKSPQVKCVYRGWLWVAEGYFRILLGFALNFWYISWGSVTRSWEVYLFLAPTKMERKQTLLRLPFNTFLFVSGLQGNKSSR